MIQYTIKGNKGPSIFYQFNPRIEGDLLLWNSLPFYTPLGDQVDENNFTYFTVPAGSISLARDSELDIEMIVKIQFSTDIDDRIHVYKILEGTSPEERPKISCGLEGDIVFFIYIPDATETAKEIKVEFKTFIEEGLTNENN